MRRDSKMFNDDNFWEKACRISIWSFDSHYIDEYDICDPYYYDWSSTTSNVINSKPKNLDAILIQDEFDFVDTKLVNSN